jgi:ribosome-associated protein
MLRVTPTISIDDSELQESFIASTGPGGQNVNKVATAVQLRFDVLHSPALPDPVRLRLIALSGSRLTKDGVLILTGRQYRTQERNRADVRERLMELVREAAVIPKKRRPTKPTRASKERRLEGKKARANTKRGRSKRIDD